MTERHLAMAFVLVVAGASVLTSVVACSGKDGSRRTGEPRGSQSAGVTGIEPLQPNELVPSLPPPPGAALALGAVNQAPPPRPELEPLAGLWQQECFDFPAATAQGAEAKASQATYEFGQQALSFTVHLYRSAGCRDLMSERSLQQKIEYDEVVRKDDKNWALSLPTPSGEPKEVRLALGEDGRLTMSLVATGQEPEVFSLKR